MIDINEIRSEIESGQLEPIQRDEREGYTGYQIWKITIEVFQQLNIERPNPLTSQYVYNILKGRQPKGTKMSEIRYNEEEMNALVRMFVKRNLQYRIEK